MAVHASFHSSATDISQISNTQYPEYAFIGRSNVGKSCLINLLCGNRHLAKTSQTPGKTLLINHFLVEEGKDNKKWFLVDLPGYGYAQVSKTQQAKLKTMIERYLLLSNYLVNTFVLIDSRHNPMPIDTDFMYFLGKNNIPFSIVFTKIDKLSKMALNQNIATYKEVLSTQWEELPPIFLTSSTKNIGGETIIEYIGDINRSLQ